MGKKYKGPGKVVTVPAPANVNEGQMVIVGSLRGIALHGALSGENVEIQRDGKHEFPKSAAAITAGANVYWHTTNKNVSSTSTGSVYIGNCPKGAAGSDAVCEVILDESFLVPA